MEVKRGKKGYKIEIKQGKEDKFEVCHDKKQVTLTFKKKEFKPHKLMGAFFRVFKEIDEGYVETKEHLKWIVYGAYLADWKFGYHKKEEKKKKVLYLPSITKEVKEAQIFIEAQLWAREIANTPANIATPEWMVKKARELKKLGLEVKVLDKSDMRKLGMNLFLAVNQGSRHGAYLVQITYKGGKESIALLGKGVCFDTGGLSLKPPRYMYTMHMDKSGAAVVMGVMRAIAQLKPNKTVHGFLALTENAIDSNAIQPGAVVKAMDGTYVEIPHTDAEGRLILADSLAYIYSKVKPDKVIDIATLTGAAHIVLGRYGSPIMGNDKSLVKAIMKAGEEENERYWELPLWDEYKELLKSNVADLRNIGGWDGEAATIIGGKFLEHFTKKKNWTHIDIASTMQDKSFHQELALAPATRTLLRAILEE
ncbi:MAG: leucyl aminopeptidase family protein [Candidatus Micrarchaeota archaeon]|nr:leucyl aminopeptidase family protein [Candidatus Micrarchaeota archaeon]